MKKKIYFLSVSRSDFDRYSPIIKSLNKYNKSINTVLISGSHYSSKFGNTYKIIQKSGFNYIKAIDKNYITHISEFSSNIVNITSKLSKILYKNKPDILVILGDRYEMIAGPLACLDKNIPIIHIHGGAVTYGAIDENIRHSLTKLSNFHIVSHEKYLKRIMQMGEEKWRIKNLGAPGLDFIKEKGKKSINKIFTEKYNLKKNNYILICLNPETRALSNLKKDIKELLKFLKLRKEIKIFTYPNSDPGCELIISSFQKFTSLNSESYLIKNFENNDFYPILNNCKFLIGNSSVGIVEAASFKKPVINLGERQSGKIHPYNVINSRYSLLSITNSLKIIESKNYLSKIKILKNPYGDGKSGTKIAQQILKLKINNVLMKKKFIDK